MSALVPAEQLLTIPDVRDRLRCSRGHVYTLIANGELDTVDIAPKGHASKTRVTEGSLNRYIAERLTNARELKATG